MSAPALRISHLRCEYLVAPLGIDERAPRLSWTLASDRRGARQTAYRVRVAGTAEKLVQGEGDLWDTGRVESNQTTHIVYAGRLLESRDVCHWCVEVWDEAGHTARSEPSLWTMGLLEKTDWSAHWIAADPRIIEQDPEAIAPTLTEPGTPALFRKEFVLPSPVKRATLYATARGLFRLRLRGRRVGEDIFAPEWTDYDKRIHYRTYDVTGLVGRGRNVIAACWATAGGAATSAGRRRAPDTAAWRTACWSNWKWNWPTAGGSRSAPTAPGRAIPARFSVPIS
jgi:alpha-L-rhamnosidase